MNIQTTELTPAFRRRSVAAIEAMHVEYNTKGGIGELGETLRVKLEGTSAHIYGLARFAYTRSGSDQRASIETFRAMCSYAEEAYKTKHSVTSVREALPSWATLKSYVLRGMTLGLSPLEYDTETKFRAAAAAKIGREPGAVVTAIATAIQRSGPVPFDEVEGFVATTTIAEPLRVMVSNLVFSAEIVKPGKIAQAEEVLRKAWHDLSPYIDKRKLT